MQSNHVTVKDLFDPGMHNNYDYCSNVAIGKNDHHNAFSRIQFESDNIKYDVFNKMWNWTNII